MVAVCRLLFISFQIVCLFVSKHYSKSEWLSFMANVSTLLDTHNARSIVGLDMDPTSCKFYQQTIKLENVSIAYQLIDIQNSMFTCKTCKQYVGL